MPLASAHAGRLHGAHPSLPAACPLVRTAYFLHTALLQSDTMDQRKRATGNATSEHKVVLQDHNSKPFGSVVTQSALSPKLEVYGSVWSIDFAHDGALCFVTFKEPDAVSGLVNAGHISVANITFTAKNLTYMMNTPVCPTSGQQNMPTQTCATPPSASHMDVTPTAYLNPCRKRSKRRG